MDDFERLDDGSGAPVFQLKLVPETGGENNHVSLCLHVEFPPDYPEASPPKLKVKPDHGLEDAQLAECEAMLIEAAASDELAGTPMVYSLVEKAQAWLVEHNVPETDMHTAMLQRQKAAAEAAGEVGGSGDAESAGATKGSKGSTAEGTWRADPTVVFQEGTYTPVTQEAFAAWRLDYDAEQARLANERAAALAKKKGGGASADAMLTGRQLFEARGALLVADDAGALDEGEEDVMDGVREASGYEGEGEDDRSGEVDPELLDAIGDAALFDDDDLEDLPDE